MLEIEINKPDLIIDPSQNLVPFSRSADVQDTIDALLAGQTVLITEFYNNGLALLKELHNHLKKTQLNDTFIEQRAYRAEFQKLSNQILVEVEHHNLALKKAPYIGWFKKLYPETKIFYLPLPQVQGMNSAWQWYKVGVSVPVLRNKIHPYYSIYFPTRFEHLILFDNWLKRYQGPKKFAMDIGVGSGVLSLMMVQHGFQKVLGTDTNPNAIVGLADYMGETKLSRKIELDYGNLFGKFDQQTDLIVFNPPWLPQSSELNKIDEAIYYNEQLFPAFFEGAKERLLPEGKLLLIFSNLAQITEVIKEHPIQKELADGGRFQLERCFKKKVKPASENTNRNQHWRLLEEVELWVLTHV